MHDHIEKIQQGPTAAVHAFEALGAMACTQQTLMHMFGQGLDLGFGITRGNQEKIADVGTAPHVEHHQIVSLFLQEVPGRPFGQGETGGTIRQVMGIAACITRLVQFFLIHFLIH